MLGVAERLVKQLGGGTFKEREAATKRLTEIGEPALDALYKALTSGDAEVRRRAENIVAAIGSKLYGELLCLRGHMDAVWGLSVSADGKRVLTSSNDKTLRLWDTAERNGVLIYLLLAEREIEIVADRGVKAPAQEWEAICRAMESRLKRGEFAQAALDGIGAVSRLLEREFPPRSGDRNELPDRPVTL